METFCSCCADHRLIITKEALVGYLKKCKGFGTYVWAY